MARLTLEAIVDTAVVLFPILALGVVPLLMLDGSKKTYEDAYKQEYLQCIKVNQNTKEIPNLENYCSFYAASRMK